MSTPDAFGVKAERAAVRTLFRGLFDDAAVFSPRLAPIPEAVTDHVARQSSMYADLLGPLLLPALDIADFLDLPREGQGTGLEVVLVGRPGTRSAVVTQALSRMAESTAATVVGVEIGWSSGWHQAERWVAESKGHLSPGALLSIEVPRGAELESALSDIQAHADDAHPVLAKFRTGAIPERPAPTAAELAIFIRACVDHDLSFKLTGGLHHAISRPTPGGHDQLGFLNIIAATRWALAHGAEVPEMASLLAQSDPAPILDIATRMSDADAAVLRAFFTSYGCCDVMDPVGDLVALGLIEQTSV